MLNISIFSEPKSVKCPIDCLYIHAVYVSFRPKTMTPQCICPSLESCLLKSTCVVLNTLYFLLQPTICMPLYLSMAIYHDTTMHMSFARVLPFKTLTRFFFCYNLEYVCPISLNDKVLVLLINISSENIVLNNRIPFTKIKEFSMLYKQRLTADERTFQKGTYVKGT